ncbi:MAG: sensor histidine kinase [Streptococcus parasanguinis]
MKAIHRSTRDHSIQFFSRLLFLLLVVNTLINLLIGGISRNFIKHQNMLHLEDSIHIYADSLNTELHSVERFMYSTISHNDYLTELNSPLDFTDFQENLKKLRIDFTEFQYQMDSPITFFIETRDIPHFFNASSLKLPYLDYVQLKDHLKIYDKETDKTSQKWQRISLNQHDYLLKSLHYKGRAIYAIISTQDILKPFAKAQYWKKGRLSIDHPNQVHATDSLIQADSNQTHLPFDLYVTVDYGDVFRTNIVLETLLSLVPLIIAVLSTILILYIRQRMIQPMKRLTQRLSQLDAASTKLDVIEDQGILEIDQANHKLNQVLIHMKDLQIRAYHAQLNLKKVELNYLKNQVRPHFYLNMLSMIHSMLQTKDYKEIEELTKVTSNYLRHLFQANQDFNRLADEIQHIRNYLEIQKIRYGDSIHFDLDWDPGLKDATYSPLLLQTFVENAIKHGFSFQDSFHIQLSIHEEANQHLAISLQDNGPGFSSAILQDLAEKKSLVTEDGHHIGLTNARERLDLLYPDHYTLQFSNGSQGGARIQLSLPYEPYKGDTHEYPTR